MFWSRQVISDIEILNKIEMIAYRSGDSLPGIIMEIVTEVETPVDLTDKRVLFKTRRIRGKGTTDWNTGVEVSIIDPVNGRVYFDVDTEDTRCTIGEWELIAQVYELNGIDVLFTAPTKSKTFIHVTSDPDATEPAPSSTRLLA